MSFTSTVTSLVTAETQQLRELPMPAWAYGAMAMGSLVLLLGVLWLFRNTAAKYDTPAVAGHGDAHHPKGDPPGSDRGAHH
jgi:hypothetical protein